MTHESQIVNKRCGNVKGEQHEGKWSGFGHCLNVLFISHYNTLHLTEVDFGHIQTCIDR